MNTRFVPLMDSVLNYPLIYRIRRNHGLEHATLHMLAQRSPRRSMAGHSDGGGFWIVGEFSTEEIKSAVEEGLKRMRSGEPGLAVHPNCGTNFVTSGVLAGVVSAGAMFGAGNWRQKLERLPMAALLATLALIVAQPLGLALQEQVTTCGQPGDLQIVRITPSKRGQIIAHRIVTQG